MNSIAKIENALRDIKTELAVLEKEAPGISLSFWLSLREMKDRPTQEQALKLHAALNAARLRNIALEKLTPQDRDVLGV